MNRIRKSLASILVVVISASLSFSSNAIADTVTSIRHKGGKEAEKPVNTRESASSTFAYPSTSFIVAGTAGISLFTALVSYWYVARQQGQPHNGAQNAGLAIMGAVVQAAFPEHHGHPQDMRFDGVDGEFDSLEHQAALLVDVLVQRENSVQETLPSKEDEATDQAVLEPVIEKPKRRTGKTIARSQELLETAQRFLGDADYSGPRTTRNKKERK